MAMNEKECVAAIERELIAQGFNLEKAPSTKNLIGIIVTNVINEVRKGTIKVPAKGLATSQGAVSGIAKGIIN